MKGARRPGLGSASLLLGAMVCVAGLGPLWLCASIPARAQVLTTETRAEPEREASLTSSDDGIRAQALEADRYSFVGFPIVNYNTDEGIGVGGVVALYHYAGGVKPFRDDVSLRLFLTSTLIQRHELRWEAIEAFDLPLRFRVSLGYYSTATQNFCGFGSVVTCDPALAEEAADERGLRRGSESREAFLRHFYQMRFIQPSLDGIFRWRLRDMPHRLELLAGWRLAYHLPGRIGDLEPYSGSLYSRVYPNGEEGFLSTPLLGFVLDNRDFEPWPVRGYFLEASVRGAGPYTGSRWSYGGANASLAGYFQIRRVPQIVLASRLLVDALVGDPPTEALARVVGVLDPYAFGGQWIGRGVRERRYIGKLKIIQQSEIRALLAHAAFGDTKLGIGAAWFWDAAFVGYDWQDLAGFIPGVHGEGERDVPRLIVGIGAGARILLNETFVIRLDFAVSPVEQLGPFFYTPVGNPF